MNTSVLLLCGILSGPWFVLIFLIKSALHDGYSVKQQTMSMLALGPHGWIQQVNYIVSGFLLLACSMGFYEVLKVRGLSLLPAFCVGVYALAMIGAGIFVTDDVDMQRSEDRYRNRALHAILHDACSLVVFVSLIAAVGLFCQFFLAQGAFGWAAYCAISASVAVISLFLFMRALKGGRLARLLGLFQWLMIGAGWTAIALVAARFLDVL